MTKPEHALKYHRCSDAELKRFISDRELDTAWICRETVIADLQNADLEATFRFMDLLPELRNMVYSELLTLPGKSIVRPDILRRKCNPAILATSRQVHNEAEGLLYREDNIVAVVLCLRRSMSLPTGAWHSLQVAVNGKNVSVKNDWSLGTRSINWPKFLLKMKTIRLEFDLKSTVEPDLLHRDSMAKLNHAIYDLYSMLLETGNLSILHAKVFWKDKEKDCFLAQTLSPLRLFKAKKHLDLSCVPSNVAQSISEPPPILVESRLLPGNALGRLRELKSSVDSVLAAQPLDEQFLETYDRFKALFRDISSTVFAWGAIMNPEADESLWIAAAHIENEFVVAKKELAER